MADTSEVPPLHPNLEIVNSLVSEKPECLAQGDLAVKDAALAATKYLYALSVESEKGSISHINELLSSLQPSQAPRTRSQGKRKRSPTPTKNVALSPTPLDSLYTESMNDNQIWAQLELRVKSMCDALSFILEEKPEDVDDLPSGFEDDSEDEEDFMGMDMDEDEDDSEEDDSFDEEDDDSDEEDEDEELDGAEGELDLRDEPEEDESDEEPTSRASSSKRKNNNKKHPELDDDFFSLDTFNAETERAEARSSSRGKLGDDDDDSDFEDEEIDLFAPLDGDIDDEEDSQEPMYSDFFDALPNTGKPSKAKGKSKKGAPESSGRVRFNDSVKYKVMGGDKNSSSDDEEATLSKMPTKSKKRKVPEFENPEFGFDDFDEEFGEIDDEQLASEGSEGSEEGSFDMNNEEGESSDASDEGADTRATMQRFQEDLFADEEEENDDEEGLSTHERRQAELRKQIAELEAENVGPKDWTLMGEANSRTRPQNSLLEEDLEFERRAKVAPTITEETVQDLEERIKARIIEGRFEDVVRLRRVEDKPFLPSQMIELKDTKSNQSLAQLYENDFVAAQGGPLGDDRDGKLKKEHDEIEKLWERLCGKLDALCNAHFTPKQPKAVIETISNVSTTSLESALPTTKSATTMLAPEEVYAPSSSAPVARSEMTPARKRALRGKERKQKKKARDALEKQLESEGRPRKSKGAKQDKKDALQSIVKAGKGVTVIGKDSKKKTTAKK